MSNRGISYQDSGVNIHKANRTKNVIKQIVKSTYNKHVLADFGTFGGLFKVDSKYKDPVLVSSVDGVGTKLKVAFMTGKHDTVGIDIVSHCCDDILVQGARPLFFMDYIAMAVHQPAVITAVIRGLAKGCRDNNCVLLGGEMAEMPGFYQPGEYDLAGMIVGVVEKKKIIDGSRIRPGDALLGLGSAGLHTNGYSLARKILFQHKKYKPGTYLPELKTTVGQALLAPHRSYTKSLLPLMDQITIKGLAHITGGGFPDNIIRILPDQCAAVVYRNSWETPPLFRLLQRDGRVDDREMFHVFNMGIGMVVVVAQRDVARAKAFLSTAGEQVFTIGEIVRQPKNVRII
jgi:phosphoribosylformylglycinamidine cyclo-ligase